MGEHPARRDDASDVEAYFEGYRRFPDTDEEVAALERAAIEDLKKAGLD